MSKIIVEVFSGNDRFTYEEHVISGLETDGKTAWLVAQGILYENGWCFGEEIDWEFSIEP